MARFPVDLLRVVEVAYEVDSNEHDWLRGVAEAVRPILDDGFGLAAFEFTRVADGPVVLHQSQHLWMPEALATAYPRMFDSLDPELRVRPFRMGPCVTGSQLMGMRKEFGELPQVKAGIQRFGMADSLWITATDPSGRGCGFHAGRAKIGWPSKLEAKRWGQLAAHLSSAVRLRYKLRAARGERPAAVFDPTGKLHDALGSAQETQAQEALRQAVLTIERVRGRERRDDPDAALERWRGLVRGEWTLLDEVEHDGKRFIVARQNEPRAPGPSALSSREKQVIAYARLGHHNKLIAYELGIAQSTVRVLMTRAAAKLGVRTRAELVASAADLSADG